jgi:ABC-type sugar transport system ATPase subunit
MSSVELDNVTKRFGSVDVIRGVDLSVTRGEFVALVGPSGCGKSTLLRMIAGLEDISGGTIRIGGRVVNELTPRERNIAMVFQNYALFLRTVVMLALCRCKTMRMPSAGHSGRDCPKSRWSS